LGKIEGDVFMQINNIFNNTPTGSLFSEFQKINEEQRSSRNLEYATGQSTSNSVSMDFGRIVTVFQDSNIRITVADRDYHGSNQEERFSRVTITCMRTLQATRVYHREFADEMYNKFMQMADNKELNCKVEDFTDARKNMIKMLLFEWLFAMLYGASDEQNTTQRPTMPDNQTVSEMVAEDVINSEMKDLIAEFLEKSGLQATCRELIYNFIDAMQKTICQIKPDIPLLSEEEFSQVEPNFTGTHNGATTKAYTDNLWANL